jgi:hypothetical protein
MIRASREACENILKNQLFRRKLNWIVHQRALRKGINMPF